MRIAVVAEAALRVEANEAKPTVTQINHHGGVGARRACDSACVQLPRSDGSRWKTLEPEHDRAITITL
ncbi:MAG: hypothetical protein LUO89_10215 [Methanothrix sp.]|nr:hypothetical protein [Methanothrix sp.]